MRYLDRLDKNVEAFTKTLNSMSQKPQPSDEEAKGNKLSRKPSTKRHKAKIRIQEANKADISATITQKKSGWVNSPCMALIAKHLLSRPYTCAELVQKIGIYSSSHVSHCLRRLKKAELIGSVWDEKQVCLVYYNLKLDEKSDS